MTALQVQTLSILLLSLFGCVAIFVLMNIKYLGVSMGRYLFVVIAPIAIGVCAGLYSLFPSRWRNPVLIVLSILLIVLNLDIFFRVLKPAYAETLLVKGIDQPMFCCPTAEIGEGATISQTFVSSKNNLCAIRVMFSSLNTPKSGEMIFSLIEGRDKDTVLRRINLPLKKISDNTRYFFIFPPIKNSMGKEYMFCFSSTSLLAENSVSLWYESSDSYSDGKMLVNCEPADGDLYLTTYHFIGEHPKTDWQGKREIAIKQGMYVTMRELQFYNERSKEFRKKKITHEKIVRFKKAFKNRKSLTERKK